MNYLTFSDTVYENYPIVLLVQSIQKDIIKKEYLTPFNIPDDDVIAITTFHNPNKKKTPRGEVKQFITEELMPELAILKPKYIVATDGEYFKTLTGKENVDAYLGYILDCVFGDYKVVYVPNHRAIFYDPEKNRAKIKQGFSAILADSIGAYTDPGMSIIKHESYPRTVADISAWLERLLKMNCPLAIDIEAFSLKHNTAGIGTITFCWSKTEGIAFPVDYEEIQGATTAPYGKQVHNKAVRNLLRSFFDRFQQTGIYHHISYDVYVLIYQLYMEHQLDTEGLLLGMDTLLRNFDDTKLITYLATNSCSGNKLSLKDQAQEYAGNYAQSDIDDITKIPLNKLLQYNLVDGLSTWFTYEKHYQTMVDDNQLEIYQTIFKPAVMDVIQMQLTGLPLNMDRVLEVETLLSSILDDALNTLNNSNIIKEFIYSLNEKWVTWKNSKLKKKRVTIADANETFNPNSNPQVQALLYDMLELPVINYTDSKQPSCDKDTLQSLLNHTKNPEILEILQSLLDYASVYKILSSFIPAMKEAIDGGDGRYYLCGNFNLGGTVSGRLSSSGPNLQNLPANVKMKVSSKIKHHHISKGELNLGKAIKYCIQAPDGWVFAGLDFASLEDRISALTTKDKNKLKVYTDGYDGHCLRAYAYFGDQMPDIDPSSVDSINSIEVNYKTLRQESKSPTFALTYQGTYITLMNNCGFSKEMAKQIEDKYHELYKESDEWIANQLDLASQIGYVTVAFGLRVRTPLLHQVIRGNSKTPYEAQAEGRTAGNALGQSWGLLNNRASSEFMGKVRTSEHRLSIRPCAHIHDAQYMLIKDDIDVIHYTNTHLVKAVQWQDHPDIAHDEVHLGGELSLFWPDWSNEIVIPNYSSESEIQAVVSNALKPT